MRLSGAYVLLGFIVVAGLVSSPLVVRNIQNLKDRVVAPVFWYVLFGFPGLLIYKAVNTMDSMIAYKNERYLN